MNSSTLDMTPKAHLRQDTEVTEKTQRRRFTAEYKRRILAEMDACSKHGELGALMRREGIYSSHLATWRMQRERGELASLVGKKRGPVPKRDERDRRIAKLEQALRHAEQRALRAETLVSIQKKVSLLLGIDLPENEGTR